METRPPELAFSSPTSLNGQMVLVGRIDRTLGSRIRRCAAMALLAIAAATDSWGSSDVGALAEDALSPSTYVLDCQSQPDIQVALGHAPIRIGVDTGFAWLLEISEHGQDVTLESSSAIAPSWINVPPRYGTALVWLPAGESVEIARLRPGSAPGQISSRLHCDADEATRLWAWMQTADRVGRMFTGGIGSLDFDQVEMLLSSLKREAHDARTRAWAAHLQAQAHFLAGHAADAAPAFLEAAEAWQVVGDAARAAAARVGAAEDQNRAGLGLEVIAIARADSDAPDGSHYFGVRLENARCLALHYAGDLHGASECYAWTTAQLESLDEMLELAAIALDFAAVERSLERFDSATDLALRSLGLATGPQSLPVQGRAHFFLADLAIRSGDIAEALMRLRTAGERFSDAGEVRWQASMLTRYAALLTDVGAYGDARIAAGEALSLLDRRHAAARVASVEVTLARIDLAEGDHESGLRRSELALRTFQELSMPEESALAALGVAQFLLATGRFEDAMATLDGVGATTPLARGRLELARAETHLAMDRIGDAEALLQGVRGDQLSFDDMLRRVRVDAWIRWRQGRTVEALEGLHTQALALYRLAETAGGGLLSQALMQRLLVLRQSAIEMIADHITTSVADAEFDPGAVALEWLVLSTPPDRRERSGRTDVDTLIRRVDQSVGRVLLGASSVSSGEDWQALLHLLEASAPHEVAAKGPAEPKVWQQGLASRGDVLALVPGERVALLVEISGDRMDLHPIGGLAELRDVLRTLISELQVPTGNISVIDANARELSSLLLQPMAERRPPERLQVLATGLGPDVPWALLRWPGDPRPLVHGSALVLVEPTPRVAASPPIALDEIDVLQAVNGLSDSAGMTLPPLLAARNEARVIQASIGGVPVRVHPTASRQQLLQALAHPGGNVHVSSHGVLSPGLLVGNGLWLHSDDGMAPDYVSWIDVYERGASANLLVLNACQLAEADPSAVGASINFATALSRAGVQHVIAARWPVSDTASNLWVPAFYQMLATTDPPDPGQALAEARRRLLASRAFRHPFHWAGWVHVERIGYLAPKPAASP